MQVIRICIENKRNILKIYFIKYKWLSDDKQKLYLKVRNKLQKPWYTINNKNVWKSLEVHCAHLSGRFLFCIWQIVVDKVALTK